MRPYIDMMKNKMSALLSIPCEMIGISATTNEKIGELGSSEAIACFATVSLLYK